MVDVGSLNLVTISCADHSQYVALALRNLFDSNRGTDFDFRFGGESVRTHRLIVELFLAPELTETVQDQLRVTPEIKQEVPEDNYGRGRNSLDFVMEFLYKGEVAVPEQQLEDLLGVAKELDFKMLIDAVQLCRPVDIIAEDELNFDTKSEIYCPEDVHEVEGPRIEDVKYKIDSFGNTGSLQLDVNRELTLRPLSVNVRSQISVNQSVPTEISGLGHFWHGEISQDFCENSNSDRCQLQQKLIKLESENGSDASSSRLEDNPESLDLEWPNSGSNEEDDGGATRGDSLYPGTSRNPRKKKANIKIPKMYNCPHCDFNSPIYNKHVSHLLKIHGLTARSKPPRKRKCPNCEFETPHVSSYRNHCMSVHQLTMRGEPAPLHKCPKCDYTSVFPWLIKGHLRTKHSQERSYACSQPQCNYAGKLKINLKQHLITIHGLGVSHFTCKVCKKHFMSPSALGRHSRIHTKERPFKCLICNFAATQLGNFKRHMRAIHSSEIPA